MPGPYEAPKPAWAPARVQGSRGRVEVEGEAFLTCWHGETDTLPWVDSTGPGSPEVALHLPIGVWSARGEIAEVDVELCWDGGPPQRFSTADGGGIAVVRPAAVEGPLTGRRREQPWALLDGRHHLVDLHRAADADTACTTCYLLVAEGVPRDALVHYRVTASTPMLRSLAGAPSAVSAFSLYAADPTFTAQDLRACCGPQGDGTPEELAWWALLHQRSGAVDHVRVDLLSTILPGRERVRPPVRVQVGDAPPVDAAWSSSDAGEEVRLPLLDRDADTVLVTVPVPGDGSVPTALVSTGSAGRPVPVDLSGSLRPVPFTIMNYCIQGLNDLFEVPHGPYDPPKTYMQLTMRDELGAWSSRPGSQEDGDPDGYAFTFEAHRHYRIPAMWAFNAAVLTMIAHDCPEELGAIRADVTNGCVVPINAGFGAHRPPYYDPVTNREEIRRGQQAIRACFPDAPDAGLRTYYPDQRLYTGTDGERAVYGDHELVDFLVLDRSTLCHLDPAAPQGPQVRFFDGPGTDADQVHRDPATGCRILPIEDRVRETMVGADDEERLRGKAARELRLLCFRSLHELAGAPDDDQRTVVLGHGDDADLASGCGWFDGDYAGQPLHFDEKYQATLCWLSRHPWVRVVTVVDLDDQPATPLAQPLASASCPSVDPGGGSTLDCYGNLFHFDTWERQWAAWCSPWLGRELGDLSDDVEQALLTWPSQPLPGLAGDGLPDPALVDLAWMTFLGLHHEMMWNKEALESRRVNECFGVLSPEDFVVAASLQLRNALVHLHAAVWSAWAAGQPAGAATWVDGGPVLDLLVQAGRAGAGGLHWDADLLQNDVLYNREVLAVLDRNGGRITHLFTRRPGAGGALCLSGTPKAYQWTTPVRRPGEREEDWVTCDGGVLENTVLTPNHLYVASDLDLAAARPGWRHEDRARQVSPQPWLYPDVFDEYESVPDQATGSVRYRYGPPRGPQPSDAVEGSAFHEACVQDRRARLDGVGTPVVWHREGLDLAKTITLAGRRLTVDYDRAPPGHRVANEFCIDVRRALTGDPVQQRRSGRTWVEVSAPGGAGARVTAAAGCRVDGVSRLTDPDAARAAGQLAEFRRLHRVLTDAVVVECPDGGALRYTIDLKHA